MMFDLNDPVIREQVERAMANPERVMPSERARLEEMGLVAKQETANER